MADGFIPIHEREAIEESFSIIEEAAYLEYFRENGFVVIRGVISAEEVDDTVDEIWENGSLLGQFPDLDRDDPTTWTDENWPAGDNRGFLNSINPSMETMCWSNRQNPNLVKVFQTILNSNTLWVKGDRYGIMRPTTDIPIQMHDDTDDDNADHHSHDDDRDHNNDDDHDDDRNRDVQLLQRPEWRTKDRWLHWDQNPWSEPDFVRVQGILALSNHTQLTGGFACVPAFHKKFKSWAESHPEGSIPNTSSRQIPFSVPSDDAMQDDVVPILLPKGSLVVWDSRLPHQNYPNHSSQFRIVQYITFSVADDPDEAQRRREKIREQVNAGIGIEAFPGCLSPLGRLITGVDIYPHLSKTHQNQQDEFQLQQLSPEEMEKRQKAADLWAEAEKKETMGDLNGAMQCYARACKLYPDIEKVIAQVV